MCVCVCNWVEIKHVMYKVIIKIDRYYIICTVYNMIVFRIQKKTLKSLKNVNQLQIMSTCGAVMWLRQMPINNTTDIW